MRAFRGSGPAGRLPGRSTTINNTQTMKHTKKKSPAATTAHVYILLDRSGSMAGIAPDVIGGFNTFLDEQRAAGPDARITLCAVPPPESARRSGLYPGLKSRNRA